MRSKFRSRVKGRNLFMVQLVIPALLALCFFQIVPIAKGVIVSLQDFRLYRETAPFCGLANYRDVLLDPYFYKVVLFNTFLFVTICLSIEFLFGLSIAVMYNKRFRGAKAARVILLLPLMIPPVLIGLMFAWIFNDQFGVINLSLSTVGMESVPWLVYRWTSLFVVVLAEIWTHSPFFALLLLAGLQTIPSETCEAARIDGAGSWQLFWKVVFPILKPVVAVCLLIRFFDLFRAFDEIWAITGGGPARATEIYSIYAYRESFRFLKFGIGTAASLIGAIIVMGIGIIMYKTFVSLVR